MNTVYRTHKNRMFQHYSVFNSKEEALEHPYPEMNKEEWTRRRSAINKENRAKLKIVHTSGARSFPTHKSVVISSVDLSRKLEEARLEIEEMRARQLEYEALLVKWSDMEQTMREHLQMMEEQQRRKMKS
ncbi:hypothetical protein CJ030_MR5G008778 [Morella rubra]|uniref:Uncharacterized protein n=1 Tax=Morella rubra TaxID=262757 RepID=A0A6A1WT93_9ROSI|nr:hypothetical protein CJ030_MR5G008778 [Morella rubra]